MNHRNGTNAVVSARRADARQRDLLVLDALWCLAPTPETAGVTRTASVRCLALSTGMSIATVSRALKSLQADGRIRCVRRGKGNYATVFRLLSLPARDQTQWLFTRTNLGITTQLVWQVLSESWQSTLVISQLADCSPSTTRRALRILLSTGLIEGSTKSLTASGRNTIWRKFGKQEPIALAGFLGIAEQEKRLQKAVNRDRWEFRLRGYGFSHGKPI